VSTLYFDLQCGISGDMAVAAMLGLGTSIEELRERLEPLGLGGYRVELGRERRSGFLANAFSVVQTEKSRSRGYGEIRALIAGSGLEGEVKSLAEAVFEHIARAESLVHGVPVDEVHFHEIGAVDSIVDIVSFAILYEKHGFSSAMASPIPLGSGLTESMHGAIPVPAPATLEIVKGLPVTGTHGFPSSGVPRLPATGAGAGAPATDAGAAHEFTTPTGAAIVKTVVGRFGPLPPCVIREVSMGCGKRRTHGLNALRLLVIEETAAEPASSDRTVAVIEVTIDDSTPEEIGFLTEELFAMGVLDAYVTPVYMKKNRPAFNVTIVCAVESLETCSRAVLERSSSLGLRYQYYNRRTLERTVVKVETRFGPISVKVGMLGGRAVKASPEFEDCRAAARASGAPLREVYREAEAAYQALAHREGLIQAHREEPRTR
jgi:uncharacterized protein (DUF111 family)